VSPLVWLVRTSAALLLKPFGIDVETSEKVYEKDELMMMIRAGGSIGTLEKGHADVVSRALKLDGLTAKDVMIHRLDIGWLDLNTPREEILQKVEKLPHSRIPVCRGDIDDVAGICYLHDLVKWVNRGGDGLLEELIRPVIAVPENLGLDRIVHRMREDRTQIVIVLDEYGGTSGLITLEDVVEELFGELEDSLESERPPIEVHENGRVTARANVRFDELVSKLGIELSEDPTTDTLAELIIDSLGRIPQVGDQVNTPIGPIRVDNMARRRITRISLRLPGSKR
jgi:putative hemolysin